MAGKLLTRKLVIAVLAAVAVASAGFALREPLRIWQLERELESAQGERAWEVASLLEEARPNVAREFYRRQLQSADRGAALERLGEIGLLDELPCASAGPKLHGTARVSGTRVELDGVRFELMQRMADAAERLVYVDADKLPAVRIGTGEWDTEFALLANAALPFRACVLHAGEDDWHGGVSFADLQLRAYVLDGDEATVASCVEERLRLASETLVDHPQVDVSSDEHGQRVVATMELFFTDYGGTARVDVRARQLDSSRVLVFVFLHTWDKLGPIHDILESVVIDSEGKSGFRSGLQNAK